MRKLIFLFLVFFAANSFIRAQTLDWVKGMGGTDDDRGLSIAVDDSGNVYTTGLFQETVDFDPNAGITNLTSVGSWDIFIQKLDASGNLIWAKSMGGASYDQGRSIALDDSGNVYITGYFHGSVDFDPNSGTHVLVSKGPAIHSDIFIQKLDAAGNLIWAKSLGGNVDDEGAAISLDGSGNVHITGYIRGSVDLNPNSGTLLTNSFGDEDMFILKLDSGGNFLWANRTGGNDWDAGRSITIDDSGNVYTTGYFEKTVDFDPDTSTSNLTSAGGRDIFIQKLDSFGNFLWAKRMGGTDLDMANSIYVDIHGNVHTTGTFIGVVDFNPSLDTSYLTAVGSFDIYIQKLDAAGDFLWAKSMGSNHVDIGDDIIVDNSGNVYTLGNFRETVDFDPGTGISNITSSGLVDMFIQKLDAGGDFLWVKKMGGFSADGGISITRDVFSNIYTTGVFRETVDFDPNVGVHNLTSSGNNDSFIQKLEQCASSVRVDTVFACDSYTWIDGNTYTSANNIATHILLIGGASNGCDSILKLDLTINTIDVSLSSTNFTLTANAIGASYQWLDCNNGYSPINGETSQSFTASNNGNYAVEVTGNGCIDTSACTTIATVGIEQNALQNEVFIYPNPTTGLFQIELPKGIQTAQVKIVDNLGRTAYQQKLTQQKNELNLSHLSTGIYHINLISNTEEEFYGKIMLVK